MGDSSEVQLGGILYVTGNKGNSGKLISYGNHEGKYSINFYFGESLSFQMIKFYLSIVFYDIYLASKFYLGRSFKIEGKILWL